MTNIQKQIIALLKKHGRLTRKRLITTSALWGAHDREMAIRDLVLKGRIVEEGRSLKLLTRSSVAPLHSTDS